MKNKTFSLTVPSGSAVSAASTTSINVSFPNPPTGSPITDYEASIKDGSVTCSVSVTTSPRECSLVQLQAGTRYGILTTASFTFAGSTVKSAPFELTTYTIPNGEYIQSYLAAWLAELSFL